MVTTQRFLSPTPKLRIIAAAFSGGQPKDGVEQAPEALLKAGLKSQLLGLGWEVEYDGKCHTFENLTDVANDLPIGIVKNPRLVGNTCKYVAHQVETCQKQGKLALTLGGDHSLGLGTVFGSAKAQRDLGRDLCVIWVDAHADINTVECTPSGNLHGMPVSFLMQLNHAKLEGFEWLDGPEDEVPVLRANQIVYIGLRDVDAGEKKILKQCGIKAFSMHDVDKYGIGRVVELALDHVNPKRDLPIHLSFDVDALDPSVAPATGTPVRGGLTFREGHYICEAIHETGLLVAFDVMEVNPTLGDAAQHLQTVQIGCSLTRAALGETLL